MPSRLHAGVKSPILPFRRKKDQIQKRGSVIKIRA
jgi:hypothetical protein